MQPREGWSCQRQLAPTGTGHFLNQLRNACVCTRCSTASWCEPVPEKKTYVCAQCGDTFTPPDNRRRKFCSRSCQLEAEGLRCASTYKPIAKLYGIGRGNVGALSELVVCVDLIRKGYEVFRAVSAHCSCDLTILRNGTLRRVEVRTAYRKRDGGIYFPISPKDAGRYDIFAAVVDGVPVYQPELPHIEGGAA
jgi:hypothetical protein